MTRPYTLVDVLLIVSKRLKQSGDSLEVFKGLTDLSIASKELKKSFNDEILFNISFKYVRGRTRFVRGKLKHFIRNSDFIGYKKCADLFVKLYSQFEVRGLLNNLLLYTTQHSTHEFLRSYLEYSKNLPSARALPKKTLVRYFEYKYWIFDGFHPRILLKSLRMSYNNKWKQKTILLFDLLLEYLHLTDNDVPERETRDYDRAAVELVREAVLANSPLDFTSIGNTMLLLHRSPEPYRRLYRPKGDLGLDKIVKTMVTDVPDPTRMLVSKNTLALPLDQQPWFYGQLSMEDVNSILDKPSVKNCFILSFRGSKPCFFKKKRSKIVERELNERSMTKLSTYGLPPNGNVHGLELYNFYRSLLTNDLEAIKKAYPFSYASDFFKTNWNIIDSQPHPLNEYLNQVIDDINEDVFQWLLETLGPIAELDWKRQEVPQNFVPALRRILEKGAKIKTDFLVSYLKEDFPVKKSQMTLLSDRWIEKRKNRDLFKFIFSEYPHCLRQNHVISDKKLLILLAWQFDASSPFSLLPKELIRSVIEYANEGPLTYQFARIMAQDCRSIAYEMTSEAFRSPYALQFLEEFESRFTTAPMFSLFNCKFAMFKRDMKFLKDFIARQPERRLSRFRDSKLMQYFLKYEVDAEFFNLKCINSVFMGVWIGAGNRFIIETLKTKNKVALKFLLKNLAGPIEKLDLTKNFFNANIKPKHNITYQQAIDLITSTYKECSSFAK